MLGIKYNGQFLELPDKYSITMKLYNAFFRFETIEGDFSYSFTLPNINANNKILGYPDVIENTFLFSKNYDVQLYIDDYFWRNAVLNIENIEGKVINVNLKASAGEFAVKTSGKLLKDINFGTDIRIPEAYRYKLAMPSALNATIADWVDVVIGPGTYHYMIAFNETLIKTLQDVCAAINIGTATHHITASCRFYGYGVSSNEICFFYLQAKTFGTAPNTVLTIGYSANITDHTTQLDNLSLTVGDYEALKNHMTNSLNWPYYRDFFPMECFPSFFNKKYGTGEAQAGYAMFNEAQYINEYDGTLEEYVINASDFPNTLAIPFPYAKFVVEKILADSGYGLAGKFFLDPEIQTLIFSNQRAVDTAFEEYPLGGITYWLYAHKINIARHLGSGTAGDLIKGLRQTFGLVFYFNSSTKKCYVETIKSVLNKVDVEDWTNMAGSRTELRFDPYDGIVFKFTFDGADAEASDSNKDLSAYTIRTAVNTLADLPTIGNKKGDLRLVLDHNFWYLVNDDEINWSEVGEFLQDFKIGNGEKEIISNLSPMCIFKDQFIITGVKKMLIPVCSQPGTSDELIYSNEYALRLLFYRGIQKDGNGKNYPMASSDIYNYAMDKVGNYSLKWDGAYGIIRNFYSEYINFLKGTKPVKFPLYFTVEKLLSLDIMNKKRIDRAVYIPDNIELVITEEPGIKSAVGEFWLVNMGKSDIEYNTYGNEDGCLYLEFTNPDVVIEQIHKNDHILWLLYTDGCCEGEKNFELYSGSLPDGLELLFTDGNWEIVGTTGDSGTYSFVLRLYDACGNVRFYSFTVTVNP